MSLKDIPLLKDCPYEFTWDMHPTDKMTMVVYHWSIPVMQLSMYEAIESCSRSEIIKHIRECDNTPWLKRWQEEKNQELVEILTKEY
jgi:uncharacterized membrane protein